MKRTFHRSRGGEGAAQDVASEIELHLDLRRREFEAMGMSADQAQRAALDAFGDRDAIQGEVTKLRGATIAARSRREWFGELRQDLTIGWRGLRRAPAFTIVALLTLALGIGANTAIFSVVRSVLLRPLPYPAPEQLVQLWTDHRALGRADPEWHAPPDFIDWREGNRTFSAMAAYQGSAPDLTGKGDPETLQGMLVSGNYLSMLGASASLGRLLTMADDDAGAEPVAVISDALWKRRFGGDTAVVGRQLQLNGVSWRVVGVIAPGFRPPFAATPEIYRALRRPTDSPCGRGCINLRAIGRLKPNVTLAAAHADLSRIAARLATEYPATNAKVGVWLVPLREQITGDSKASLFALSGAVAFVLLIGCVNLANLLLTRGAGRARELSVRAALGAGRGRIVRQLLTENVLLALLGGALGVLLGVVGSRVLATLVPQSVRIVQQIGVDSTVLAFAAVITLASALLFGLLPAIHAVRPNVMDTLRSGMRDVGAGTSRMRNVLVVTQLSLAVVLLAGAGLLGRSFLNMQRVDVGYRQGGVAFAAVSFPAARYDSVVRAVAAIEDVTARLRADPSIRSAELTSIEPLSGDDGDVDVVPVGVSRSPNQPPSIWFRRVSSGYLRTMQMRILAGRGLEASDRRGGAGVAVINEEAAQRYFPGLDAVGREFALGSSPTARRVRVIGIVANGRHDGPREPVKPEMFVPLSQSPARNMRLVIEPAGDLRNAAAAMRRVLHEVDPLVPAPALEPIDERLGDALALPKLYALLVLIFAGAALLLAALGVYGVMAYSVSQRRRELGVRLALGAQPTRILRMVMSESGRLATIGVALGVIAALALARLVQSLLFGVSPADTTTLAVVVLVLSATTVVASWLPARRAMKLDPLSAIRSD